MFAMTLKSLSTKCTANRSQSVSPSHVQVASMSCVMGCEISDTSLRVSQVVSMSHRDTNQQVAGAETVVMRDPAGEDQSLYITGDTGESVTGSLIDLE